MTQTGKGFILGVVVAALLVGFGAAASSFHGALAIPQAERYDLSVRVDGAPRSTVFPLSLGEVSVARRSWLLVTSYEFLLRVRPELVPRGPAAPSLTLSVTTPGSVRATNATRIEGGRIAVWAEIPADGARVRSRVVHWGRIVVLLVLLAAAMAAGRR